MGTRTRDGGTWRIGTAAEVAWIANGISTGRTITAAIPPVFGACATVVLPYAGEGQDEHGRTVLPPDRNSPPMQTITLKRQISTLKQLRGGRNSETCLNVPTPFPARDAVCARSGVARPWNHSARLAIHSRH